MDFYLTYFRKEKCAPGTACKVPNPKLKRFNRAMLWIAAVAVLGMAFFPNYVGFVAGTSRTSAEAIQGLPTLTLNIEGMTCEACSLHVKNSLEKVPGVHSASVTYSKRQAVVAVDPGSQPSAESLVKAIEEAGYKASVEIK